MAIQNKRVLQQVGLSLCGLTSLTLMMCTPSLARGGSGGGGGGGGGGLIVPTVAVGACSKGTSTWELKTKPKAKDGTIDIQFQVNSSNVEGQTWSNLIKDNTKVVSKSNQVAIPPVLYYGTSGYTIDVSTRNQAGDDVITVKATNLTTKEICSATVTEIR